MKSKPKKLFWIVLIVLIIVLAVFIFKNNKKQENVPICADCNIIFIDIGILRADHLGIYGYYRNTSPNIDAFARKSILFKNAYSQSRETSKSIDSYFTSRLFLSKKQIRNNITLTKILKEQGYVSQGFFSNSLPYALGDMRKILPYLDVQSKDGQGLPITPIKLLSFKNTFNYSLEFIKNNKVRKFFLYLHSLDLHTPYHSKYGDYFDPDYPDHGNIYKQYIDDASSGNKTSIDNYLAGKINLAGKIDSLARSKQKKHIIAHYDGGILSVDELFGQFIYELDKSGVLNNTIIIVLSSHADDLFEEGRFDHFRPSYNVVHVPLIIYIPKVNPKIIDSPVSLIDIMPTTLNLVDINTNYKMQGINLIPLIENPKSGDKMRAIAGYQYVIKGEWKLQTIPTLQLYNIKYDPNESNNLADKEPELVKELMNDFNNLIIKMYLDKNK